MKNQGKQRLLHRLTASLLSCLLLLSSTGAMGVEVPSEEGSLGQEMLSLQPAQQQRQEQAKLETGPPLIDTATLGDISARLQSFTASAGQMNKHFDGGDDVYEITLSPDETSCVLTAAAADSAARVTLAVDGAAQSMGTPIAVAAGQKKTAVITVANSGTPSTYTFRIYRTQSRMECTIGAVTQAGGASGVDVTFRLFGGAAVATLQTRLDFNPQKLQLADAKNVPTTIPGEILTAYAPDMFAENSAPLELDNARNATLLDNTNGTLRFILGTRQGVSNTIYQSTDGQMVFKFHFKLVGGTTAVSSADFCIGGFGGGQLVNGLSLYEKLPDDSLFAASYPWMLHFAGETIDLKRPNMTNPHGTITLTPNKQLYAAGETVTLQVTPDAGYAFSGWQSKVIFGERTIAPATLNDNPIVFQVKSDYHDMSSMSAQIGTPDTELSQGAKLDFSQPYEGDYILAYNPAFGSDAALSGNDSKPLADNAQLSDSGEPTPVNWVEQPPTLAGQLQDSFAMAFASNPALGDKQTFKTRDARVSNSGLDSAWAAKSFTLAAQNDTLNVWTEDGNALKLTTQQCRELLESFATSSVALAQNWGAIVDADGGGRLDILLYDIQDGFSGSGGYIAGLTNAYEMYGLVGNRRDVVHLDTYPSILRNASGSTPVELSRAKSTMAHEAQHLVMASSYQSKVAGMGGQSLINKLSALQPPTWINEGMSMAVEHALFGAQQNRISMFNSDTAYKNGYALTSSAASAQSYPLPYLFFQYVKAQAGSTTALQKIYGLSFENDANAAALMTVLSTVPAFQGMTFDDIAQAFYLALEVNDRTGLYGFGDTADFDNVVPQLRAGETGTVPSSGATLLPMQWFKPTQNANNIRYVGVTLPTITLTAASDAHGSVQITGEKPAYQKGESATVTATPSATYAFAGWTGDVTDAQRTQNPLLLTMGRSKSVQATFAPAHRVTLQQTAGGTVSASGAENLSAVPNGTVLQLTATPNEGYWFHSWTSGATGGLSPASLTIAADQTISAQFRKIESVIAGATNPQPTGKPNQTQLTLPQATVLISGELKTGSRITMLATAASGYKCTGWTKTVSGDAPSMEQLAAETLLPNPLVTVFAADTTYQPKIVPVIVDDSAARLAFLSLDAPAMRELRATEPSVPGQPTAAGFFSEVTSYTLSLLENEGSVTFTPSLMSGTTAVWQKNGGTQTPITDNTAFSAAVEDGSVLTITVTDAKGVMTPTVYTITVSRRAAAGDPQVKLSLTRESQTGYAITASATNTVSGAVQWTAYVRKDMAQNPLTPMAMAGYKISSYVLEASPYTREVDGQTVAYDRLSLTAEPATEGGSQPAAGAFAKISFRVADGFNPNTDIALWDDASHHSVILFDNGVAGVKCAAQYEVLGTDITLRVSGYNPKQAAQLTLTAGNVTFTGTATVGTASGAVVQPITIVCVPQGTYTAVVGKQAHLTLTLTGLSVLNKPVPNGAAGTLNLVTLLAGNAWLGAANDVVLPCGDVDGSGTTRLADKNRLTNPSRYGKSATDICDLNGDGRVNLADFNILTKPYNYGRNNLTVDITPSKTGGGS